MIDFLIALLKGPTSIVLIILGLAVMLIAACGDIPGITHGQSEDPAIDGIYQFVLFAVGLLIVTLGLYGCFLKNGSESNKIKKLKRQSPILCEGELKDLYLGDLEKIVEMPKERRWTYGLSHIEMKIYKDVLSLEFEAWIDSPHKPGVHEDYKFYGSGPHIDDVGFLTYSFHELNDKSSWDGVMVLQIPRRGVMEGFWLTTNVNKGDKFPIGSITLKRK